MLPDNTPNHFILFNESSTSFSSWSECENLIYWHHLDPESIHPHQAIPISTIPPVDVPGTSQFKLGISRDRPYTIGNWSEFCLFVHRTRLPRPSWDGRRLLRKVAARSLYIPLSPSFLLHFPSWLGRESNPGPSDQLSSTLSTRLWQLING